MKKNTKKIGTVIAPLMIIMLFSGVVFPADDIDRFMSGSGAFETRFLKKTYSIFPFDKELFYLDNEQKGPLVFYGNEFNNFIPLTCKQNVIFSIISELNERGHLGVAICNERVALLKSLLKDVPAKVEAMLKALAPSMRYHNGGPVNLKDLQKLGWVYEKKTLKDGSELHYFPVISISEGGPTYLKTVVLIRPDNRAIVVQADILLLCDLNGKGAILPICTDTKEGLSKLVQSLEK
jgi:hypothetical protein